MVSLVHCQNVNDSSYVRVGISPESIDPSAVLDYDGVPVLVNVAVLSDSLVVARGLLLESDSIFLGISCSKLAVPHVEPLLLEDPGQAGISIKLWGREAGAEQDQALVNIGKIRWLETNIIFS